MVKAQCSTWNKRYRSGATVRTTTMIHVPIAIAIFPNGTACIVRESVCLYV
jgi:hypothetical protein